MVHEKVPATVDEYVPLTAVDKTLPTTKLPPVQVTVGVRAVSIFAPDTFKATFSPTAIGLFAKLACVQLAAAATVRLLTGQLAILLALL